MENGPHDEATVVEQNDDEDEIPSAHSPSEDVGENEGDAEPQQKHIVSHSAVYLITNHNPR